MENIILDNGLMIQEMVMELFIAQIIKYKGEFVNGNFHGKGTFFLKTKNILFRLMAQ